MGKAVKIWLIVALALVALGGILFTGAMFANGWDFNKISTVTYITNIYEVDGDFKSISIDVETTKIEFAPADDGRCKIVCFEDEKVRHSASVQNGTLVIDTVDTRKWYEHFSFSFSQPQMTIYLPRNEYDSLFIETDTGDIVIPKDFSFDTLKIDGDTSDVDCFASASHGIEIKLSTGDIRLEEIATEQLKLTTDTGRIQVNTTDIGANIRIETDTGKVELTNTSCKDLYAESDTGSITLKNVIGAGNFTIKSDTGSITFDHSDAAEISVKTDTGDVTGTLLSDKVFLTETSTGRISVPKTITGGKCELKTSTGDIKIEIIS